MSQRTQENWRKALADNLPQGEALKAKGIVGTVLYKLLNAFAYVFWRLDIRAYDLINEMFPQTVIESLAEWETEYGLPDECYSGLTLTTAERQKILLAKYASIGGQSPQYFIDIAADLGFAVTITEFNGARFTLDTYGGATGTPYGETTHPYIWYVNVSGIETIYGRFTTDRYQGTQYQKLGVDTSILECVINDLKPAHTQVIFNY